MVPPAFHKAWTIIARRSHLCTNRAELMLDACWQGNGTSGTSGEPPRLTGRLLVDCMGHFSPIVRQVSSFNVLSALCRSRGGRVRSSATARCYAPSAGSDAACLQRDDWGFHKAAIASVTACRLLVLMRFHPRRSGGDISRTACVWWWAPAIAVMIQRATPAATSYTPLRHAEPS